MERAPGKVLDLYRTRLGAQGATELASSLREWRQVRLGETSVGDVGATALAGALSENDELETLDLAYNLIGDDGAITLASSLLNNRALTQLGLEGNHVGDAGLSALSAALASNGSLCVLDLRWNAIRGEAGVSAIAGALATNTVLEDLDLSCNELGEAGVAAMADGLKENVGLRRLMLAGNDAGIGDACASAVVEALKCNSTLKELSLRFNRIGGDDLGDDAAAALRASAVLTEQSKKSLAAAYAVGTEERRMRERSEGWLRLERDRRIAELHAEAAAVIGEEIVAEIIFAEASHSISEHEEERRNEQLAAEAELAMLAAQTAAAKLNTAAPLSESIMRSLRNRSARLKPCERRTKKSWWEKGTKKLLRDAVPVWDPWDLDPSLRLHTAEHHARDEELGFWRNQAALAHGECREKKWVWSEEVLIVSAQTAARAQSAWRTFDLEYGGIRENISRPVVRHTGERGAAWAPVGGERKKGLLRPRTANPAGRVHWDAEAPMKPRPKSASAAHKLDEAAAGRPNSGFGRPPLSRVAEGSFEGKSVLGGASGGGRGGYSGDDNDTESAASFIKEDASEADLSSAGCSPQQARRMGGDTNVGAESQVNLMKMQVSPEPILQWERCRQI